MLRCFVPMERPRVLAEEIDERNGGCGIVFESKLYVWGGNRSCIENVDSEEIVVVITLPRPESKDHPFDVLNLATNEWFRQPTSGDYPSLGLGSSLTVHHPSRTIILFSGFKSTVLDDEVYKVSPETDWVWEKVRVMSEMKPIESYMTGVIIHDDRMCVFGGLAKRASQDPGAKFVPCVEDGVLHNYGWSSKYLEFNINTSEEYCNYCMCLPFIASSY